MDRNSPPGLGSNRCPLGYEPKISPADHQGHTRKLGHTYTRTSWLLNTHTRTYLGMSPLTASSYFFLLFPIMACFTFLENYFVLANNER